MKNVQPVVSANEVGLIADKDRIRWSVGFKSSRRKSMVKRPKSIKLQNRKNPKEKVNKL